jgi:predicted transcriptional regulator
MLTQIEVIEFLIEKGPGRTERELAEAIHGSASYQQQVNQDCQRLATSGKVERRGHGGTADPYRYYPIRKSN